MTSGLSCLCRTLAFLLAIQGFAANAADKVRVGLTMSTADAPIFVASERGYFAAEQLEVEIIPLDSASKAIAPLATGDLDAAGGSASAGLFNAAARQIDIRIVADRATAAPGYHYQSVIVRKDLIDSGRFKGYGDLKGMKVGLPAPGTGGQILVDEMTRIGDLAYGDVEQVFMSFPQLVVALQNKAVDIALMIEPYASAAVATGAATEFQATEQFYPGQEVSLLFYGNQFARGRADVARRFMKGWLKGARDFNNSIENGTWRADASASAVVRILAKAIGMKEEQIRSAPPQFTNPDGFVNMESLRKDLAFYRSHGLITSGAISAEDVVDMSFVNEALKELGPYKRPQ